MANVSDAPAVVNNSVPVPAWEVYHEELKIWFGFMVTFSLFSVVCHPLFVATILRSPKTRSGSGILIAHVVIISFMQSAVNMPTVYVYMYAADRLGFPSKEYCNWTSLFYFAASYAINWADLAVGVNRFVAIFFPHQYSCITGKRTLVLFIVMPWVIGFLLTIYILPGTYGAAFQWTMPWGTCGIKTSPGSPYLATSNIGMAVPLTALGTIYVTIYLHFRARANKVAALRRKSSIRRLSSVRVQNRYNSALRLFLVYLWYCTCILPVPIANGFFAKEYSSRPPIQLALRGMFLLGYSTSSFMLFLTNPQYRKSLFVMLRLQKLERRPSRITMDHIATVQPSED